VSVANEPSIVLAPGDRALPAPVARWLRELGAPVIRTGDAEELMTRTLRARPPVLVIDIRDSRQPLDIVRRLKRDSFTAVVPVVVVVDHDPDTLDAAFAAGADEAIADGVADREAATRLRAALSRSERDLLVHPSTRLPGTIGIEAEIARRIRAGIPFAACYADLDHFKEYNDRYSYNEGDRVIRMLARVLHDIVKGRCGEDGFVGHIGGDDFLYLVPLADMPTVCHEILEVFDSLVPLQYTEDDRRAGHFFGKDRRGQVHRVPLMTLSIGVATTERRQFRHAGQVSALATEMKTYAKTLPGSTFAVDRRTDDVPANSVTSVTSDTSATASVPSAQGGQS
jgi:diguanylate cyclase (GGDEF)-like protein